jgi:hypothetical protein
MQIVAGIQLGAKAVVDDHGDIFSGRNEGAAGGLVMLEILLEGVDRKIADLGLSTSGIAGPKGGISRKLVWTIWIAVGDRQSPLAVRFQSDKGLVYYIVISVV